MHYVGDNIMQIKKLVKSHITTLIIDNKFVFFINRKKLYYYTIEPNTKRLCVRYHDYKTIRSILKLLNDKDIMKINIPIEISYNKFPDNSHWVRRSLTVQFI